MDFLFVTGMSGAGKTVAVNELEDMGYFCVDNIPSGLIGAFARLCEQSPVGGRIALVTDFRSGEQFARFPEALDQLTAEGHTYRILMLEAEDSVILRRYKENRRRHPLLEEGSAGLEAAIRTEAVRTVERDPLLEQMMAEEREREAREDELRAQGRLTRTSCWYAAQWFEKHPQEQDLLYKE